MKKPTREDERKLLEEKNEKLEQENKQLKEQLAIYKKALVIMLEELKNYGKYVLEDYICDSWTIEDFIEQARENK